MAAVVLFKFHKVVKTYLGEVDNLNNICVQNFLSYLKVTEFWKKSVYVFPFYDQKSSVLFFFRHSVLFFCR